MEVCTHALLALPFLAILIKSPSLLACVSVQHLLAGDAACTAAVEVLTFEPTFDATAAHQLFALAQGHLKSAQAFALLICRRAPVQEILPALLIAYQGIAPSQEVLIAAVNRLATDPEVESTLLSGGQGQGVVAHHVALHSNCNVWSGLVTAACTLAAQLLEVAPTARLSSGHLPELSSEDSNFHLQSPDAELSDLDADSSAKAWDGQRQWQSDKAGMPSTGVALPHKIVMHLARLRSILIRAHGQLSGTCTQADLGLQYQPSTKQLDALVDVLCDQGQHALALESVMLQGSSTQHASEAAAAIFMAAEATKATLQASVVRTCLQLCAGSNREDITSTGVKAFEQLAKSQIVTAPDVALAVHCHLKRGHFQFATGSLQQHEDKRLHMEHSQQQMLFDDVLAADTRGCDALEVAKCLLGLGMQQGALLLTSYGDHGFDSLLTTEQCNAFLELCKAEIVNQCNTKDASAAVFTLLKHMGHLLTLPPTSW
ncbi:hypothetical protein WJX77_002068 [Trebouxia sp. C0004]